MNLSSPNRMIWQYFEALRRLVAGLDHSSSETEAKQDIALCVMLAVTVVEAFLNLFFRVVVSESAFTQHEQRVINDLEKQKSLHHKLKTWPEKVFGQSLDLSAPIPEAFFALKDCRNALMHFTSSHETVNLPGIEIHGLADTSVIDTLTVDHAVNALSVAEDMVCEILRLRGIPEDKLPHALHTWTGKVPT